MKFLDTKIQLYESAEHSRTPIGILPLRSFLFPSLELAERIEKVREATEMNDDPLKRHLKAQLPCACISGIVTGCRTEENISEHTGLMCIDIDAKDNPSFKSGEDLKSRVSRCREVLYCGLSVSGKGCFAIIPIAYKDKHKEHFNAISRIFADRLGIRIDEACKDVIRLRFVSFDEAPYINESPEIFRIIDKEENKIYSIGKGSATNIDCSLSDVEKLVSMLEDKEIDLCNFRSAEDGITDYSTWLKLAFSFASMGEEAEELFLRVCRLYPEHNEERSKRKFSEALKNRRTEKGKGVTIASFIKFAKDALAIN